MKLRLPRNPYLTVTYDSVPHADGIGAQTERIWGIFLWARRFNIGYYHSGMTDFVAPYSNQWKAQESKKEFLIRINEKIILPSTTRMDFDSTLVYSRLTYKITIAKYFESLLKRKKILLKVTYAPRANQDSQNPLPLMHKIQEKTAGEKIVIHIRNAEGRYGIHDRRNLEFDYYKTLLDYFRRELDKLHVSYSIKVLTDIGKVDFYLKVSEIPEDKLWIYSLTNEQRSSPTLLFRELDYKEFYFKDDDKIEVIQGGDPIRALEIMENADYLIMSRSSLSSIGGFLNSTGTVIQPPDWIYAKNSRWIEAKNLISINKDWRVARHPLLYRFISHAAMNRLKRLRAKLIKDPT